MDSDLPISLPDDGLIGGYKLHEMLITGGTTTFVRVEDASGGSFAMKVPNADCARDRSLRGRFQREIEILSALSGSEFPTLVAHGFYDCEGMEGIPYIVTDMPVGEWLNVIIDRNRAKQEPPDFKAGIRLLRNLARALGHAHERGVVHRNLKPQRISVTGGGEVQIVDFVLGIGTQSNSLTQVGDLVGTPQYIAPEQIIDAHSVDGRADLYSLGLIVFEYVTHMSPFGLASGRAKDEIIKRLTQEPAPAFTFNPGVPPELSQTLSRMLKRQPDDRFQNAQELVEHVDRVFSGVLT